MIICNMVESIYDLESWEFGAVGILDPEKSTLKRYFELIEITKNVPGELAEFGVSKGSSIVTTAMILRHLGSSKMIYGFDTFSGFPHYSHLDNFDLFEKLHNSNLISLKHYERTMKNKLYIKTRGSNLHPGSVSNSANFDNTSMRLVESKIDLFNVKNYVELIEGDFTIDIETKLSNLKFSLVLIDSDLHDSYEKLLLALWKRLSPGGYIYLDEYYSLKFPGPKIAVDEFIKKNDCTLLQLEDWLDFERWAITKPV